MTNAPAHTAPASDPTLSAPLTPALPPEAAVVAGEDDVRLARGPRSYRVRGLKHNLSAESLKVTLRVSSGDHLHLDTLDLYQARHGIRCKPVRHSCRSRYSNPGEAGTPI